MLMNRLTAELALFNIRLERWQWLAAIGLGLLLAVFSPLFVGIGLAAIMVGVAVLSQPLVGVVLALFLGPLGGWEGVFIGGPIGAITSGQLMILFTMVCWVARKLVRGQFPIASTFFSLSLSIWIVLGAATLWESLAPVDGIKEIVKWTEVLFIIWIVLDLTREWARRPVIWASVGVLLAAGVMQAIWGIFQFALRGTGPGHFIIFGRFYRATGSFMQPNPYGGYIALNTCLAIGVFAGLFIYFWNQLPESQRRWDNVLRRSRLTLLVGITVAILLFALIGSWSRGAWLNFIAALGIFALFMPKDRKRGFTFVFVAGSALFLVWNLGLIPVAIRERLFGFLATFQLQPVREILLTPENYAVVERLAHWEAAISMATEQPWFGVGIGNYAAAYPQHMVPGWIEPLGHAHNMYLNVFAEMGIVGLLGYALLWIPIFWLAIDLTLRLDWPVRGIPLGLFAGYVGLSVHHLLDNLYVNNNLTYLGATFALLILLKWDANEEQGSLEKPRFQK
jgi:O-antigen ligase